MCRKLYNWIFRKRLAQRAAVRAAIEQYAKLGAQRDWWFEHAQGIFQRAMDPTNTAETMATYTRQYEQAAERHNALCNEIFSIKSTITNTKG